jgi:CxxC-x17-CxxC domain-containing protein
MFAAVCASCGVNTQVPFEPTGSKPVYCRDCFQQSRSYY